MRILALLALVACNDHPGNGDRAVPVELDPRFGVLVDVPFPILGNTIVAAAGKGGADWIAVWADAGVDDEMNEVEESFQIYRLDPDNGFAAEAIDPPELIDRDFYLWHAFQPDQALIIFPTVLFAYDGAEWVFINPPPGLVHWDAAYVLFDHDRLFAWSGGAIAVWDGASWRSVPAPEGSTFGPLERDRFRTVSQGPCTIAWDFATLAPEAEVCAAGASDAVGWSVNGDVDGFFVYDQFQSLRRFEAGAWSEPSAPDFEGAGLVTSNAPERALLTIPRPEKRVSELHGVGTSDDVLFPASDPVITCECDRATDPTCPCANPQIALTQPLIAADGESLDLLLVLDVNGTRELRARRYDLPVATAPFSPDDAP